ncbi:hypothetical protein FOCC_FOCC001401 [Frankliniella occidentalis]|nr:hypothetical protein FOCC_FOCC001401 [Frankliniella occidentalis]
MSLLGVKHLLPKLVLFFRVMPQQHLLLFSSRVNAYKNTMPCLNLNFNSTYNGAGYSFKMISSVPGRSSKFILPDWNRHSRTGVNHFSMYICGSNYLKASVFGVCCIVFLLFLHVMWLLCPEVWPYFSTSLV